MEDTGGTGAEQLLRCTECERVLSETDDHEVTEGGTFCRPCFNSLSAQVERTIAAQGEEINYSLALIGGLLGGVAGALVWWGFTVLTSVAFGLVAVVIGFTVGKGITLFAGRKRSQGLQIMSVGITAIAFAYAKYLVTRTFIMRHYLEQGEEVVLPMLPDLNLFIEVLQAGFRIMDLVFLAIALVQAWKIPTPYKLQPSSDR